MDNPEKLATQDTQDEEKHKIYIEVVTQEDLERQQYDRFICKCFKISIIYSTLHTFLLAV